MKRIRTLFSIHKVLTYRKNKLPEDWFSWKAQGFNLLPAHRMILTAWYKLKDI